MLRGRWWRIVETPKYEKNKTKQKTKRAKEVGKSSCQQNRVKPAQHNGGETTGNRYPEHKITRNIAEPPAGVQNRRRWTLKQTLWLSQEHLDQRVCHYKTGKTKRGHVNFSNSSWLLESFVAGWLIEEWRRQKDVNMLAGQQVPLDDGVPGAVAWVLREQEHLRVLFFFSLIIYTPE